MPVRVEKDGVLVERSYGDSSIGPTDRKVAIGHSEVATKGKLYEDNDLAPDLLRRVMAGEVKVLSYVAPEGEDEGESREHLSSMLDALGDPEQVIEALMQQVQDLKKDNEALASTLATANAEVKRLQDAADADESESDSSSGQSDAESFNPDDHNQADVLSYLKDADEDEVKRVQEAEAAGQNRQGIASFKPQAAGGEE